MDEAVAPKKFKQMPSTKTQNGNTANNQNNNYFLS